MKVYDEDVFYKELEKDIKKALRAISVQIKKDIEKYIEENIYKAYDPFTYKRTKDLFKSVEIKPVKQVDGEWYVEIYISEEQHPENKYWHEEEKSYDEIIEFFEDGEADWRGNDKVKTISLAEKEWVGSQTGKAYREVLKYLKSKYDIVK